MNLHEHIFLDDGTVYVSDRRLVISQRETYAIANLEYVSARKMGVSTLLANPQWRKGLGIGLLYLFTGTLCSMYATNLSQILLLIGLGLLMLALGAFLFQYTLPTYVIVVGGNFGTQPLIKGKNRHYIEHVADAINQAISARHEQIINNSYQSTTISDSFHHASHIAFGNGAHSGEMPQ